MKNLMCFDCWGNVSCGMQCETNDSTDTSQWMCHNCSCGTRAVHELKRYRTRLKISPLRAFEIPFGYQMDLSLCAQCPSVSRQFSLTGIYVQLQGSYVSILWYVATFDVTCISKTADVFRIMFPKYPLKWNLPVQKFRTNLIYNVFSAGDNRKEYGGLK
jgi:hypothetical protein